MRIDNVIIEESFRSGYTALAQPQKTPAIFNATSPSSGRSSLVLVRKMAPLDGLVPLGGATCDDNDNQSGDRLQKFHMLNLAALLFVWGQDYKEKHKTRLKTNVKRTVLNNTKLRHF